MDVDLSENAPETETICEEHQDQDKDKRHSLDLLKHWDLRIG